MPLLQSRFFDDRWLLKRIDIKYLFFGDLAWEDASPALFLHNWDCGAGAEQEGKRNAYTK